MAPFPIDAIHTLYENTTSLDIDSSIHLATLTPSQRNTLQCLALIFATISVASAILAFYWFVKMRRSFRHDLIMLLIQSDMFKALWFMVYPIVTYLHGPASNDSIFCQVNGFFLSVGIEASDISVVMIAIHSALFILRPKPRHSGEGGLYPYRHIAYAIWAIFPLIMASLAFVGNSNPYRGDGAYCYLPVRPLWYSLALSWIPRYLIFIIIFGVYVSIYYYVRYKFSGFTRLSKKNSIPPPERSREDPSKQSGGYTHATLPSPPPPTYHGLTSDSKRTLRPETERRKQSVSTTGSYDLVPIYPEPNAHLFMWASFMSGRDSGQLQATSSNHQETQIISPISRSITDPIPEYGVTLPISPLSESLALHDATSHSELLSSPPHLHDNSLTPPQRRCPKCPRVDIFTLLSHRVCEPDTPAPMGKLHLVNSRGPNVAVSDMIRTRDKIRRQLRYLFIYPLVYIGMWMVPLVCQILQYDDRFTDLPFALRCVTTVCICSQAAVDCWLFSTREKPWRHIPRADGTFAASLRFWAGWRGGESRAGPGRTREEVVREARAAYLRREEELAERRSEVGHLEAARTERMWWDPVEVDLAMATVAEEAIDPMDDIPQASFPISGGDLMAAGHPKPTMQGEV